MAAESLVVLRILGAVLGLAVFVHAFVRFRHRHIGRGEAALRFLFAVLVTAVSIEPDVVNGLAALLAMDSKTWGRLLALLVLSNLALWLLLFRERGKVAKIAHHLDEVVRHVARSSGARGLERLEGAGILVGLPALDEAENLPSVLQRIPEEIEGRRVGVVVVDDCSSDGTGEVAFAHGAAVVRNPFRRGQGAALRVVYDLAGRVGADVVVTLDADGQHRPEEIAAVVAPILAGTSDFVIGSRILGKGEGGSRTRSIGIRVINRMINLLAGTRISDCSSGFKAISVPKLAGIVLREDQFQAGEAIISAAHGGLRISEVPITVLPRAAGTSKKGHDLAYGLGFTRTILKTWWR
ncbi:MAG: glycosyltransferase [Deltaproteobacteria bacterium]|nr:MAG: glycosyltransferase [Deltaproteobacteria bacterium]